MPREIDVIVPTRDRPQALRRCLAALAGQSFRDFRVIVIDDAGGVPVEETLPIALARRLDLRLLRNERSRGAGGARNRGLAEATARYVAFVDDDVVADPLLLERHRAAVEARGPSTVSIGPLRAPADWRPTPWNAWEAATVEFEYDRMRRGEYAPTWRQFHTGNAFVARSALERAGRFDESFARAEDIELGLRLDEAGCCFHFEHAAIGWHYSHRSLDAWLRAARQYGEYDVRIDERHPDRGWLRVVLREQTDRPAALLFARRFGRQPAMRRAVVRAATLGGWLLFTAGARRLSRAALSLAYDLEYQAAFRTAMAERRRAPAATTVRTPEAVEEPRAREAAR